MSFLKVILTDLRQRKLWPVPLVLLAAIVAVPVVLAKSAKPTPVAPLPPSGPTVSGTPVATIRAENSVPDSHLTGKGRDPFIQQAVSKTGTSVATALGGGGTTVVSGGSGASTATSGLGGSSTVSSFSGGSSVSSGGGSSFAGGGSSSSSSTSSSGPVSPLPPHAKPTPAPSGLTAKQSYRVAVSLTNASGGVDSIDPLVRLSPLPSASRPLVVELGVLQGGHRVLFAVQPGTVVHGAGTCTPGPIDCEILSLGQDQVETISSGSTSASFAVTAITADDHATAALATAARELVSVAGHRLLASSPLSALSLFEYQPQVGAVVDLRNLTVGGN